LNLQEKQTEPYYACPYCLTKLEIEQPKREEEKVSFEKLSQTQPEKKQDKNRSKEKAAECQLHPGYLSERSSKEQIPDGCLVCKDIVECMLKKMRD
jgi:hypothetical protein